MGAANTARLVKAAETFGLFGATPVAQPSSGSQAAVAQTQTTLSQEIATASVQLADVTTEFNQHVLNKNFGAVNAKLALTKTDVAALVTLVNQLRSDLVTLGIIKGSA